MRRSHQARVIMNMVNANERELRKRYRRFKKRLPGITEGKKTRRYSPVKRRIMRGIRATRNALYLHADVISP